MTIIGFALPPIAGKTKQEFVWPTHNLPGTLQAAALCRAVLLKHAIAVDGMQLIDAQLRKLCKPWL